LQQDSMPNEKINKPTAVKMSEESSASEACPTFIAMKVINMR